MRIAVARSDARYSDPRGIHVSLPIIVGVIATPCIRAMLPEQPDECFLDLRDIATGAPFLTGQQPGAGTFGLDLLPPGKNGEPAL